MSLSTPSRIASSFLTWIIAGSLVAVGPVPSASAPQSQELPKAQAPVQEKEQQSNYQSFLGNPKQRAQEEETGAREDDAAGRIDWWRMRMGGEFTTEFKQRLISEAENERAKYPGMFLGDVKAGNTVSAFNAPLQPLAVTGTSWTPIGPTASSKTQNGITMTVVDSGRARTILPHPTDANTVYFLTSGGGLWKTSNFLSNPPTWAALTDGIGSTSGGAAAFGGAHPTNVLDPNVLYVGFGDPFDGGVGGIIAKTSNGGGTFPGATKAVLPGVSIIYDVKVDFSQSAGDIVLVGTNAGLFRSTNGGTSYGSVATLGSGKVWSIVQTSAGWLASVDTSGTTKFSLSTDLGATWSSTVGVTTPASIGRTTLGVGVPGDAVVYAFATTTNASAQKDLYRSANGGATWTATSTNSSTAPTNTNGNQSTNDYMHTQAFYNQMLLVDPTDSARNTVYIGGNYSSAMTTTGGSSWTVITNWLPGSASGTSTLPYAHADFHAAAFLAGSPNRIYFGSDGGIFVSTDGGTTFDDTKNKGLQSHLIYAMSCGFNGGADKNSVLVGLQDNGTRLRKTTTLVYDQTKGGDGFGVGWSQANNAWTIGTYVYNDIDRCITNPPDDQSKWNTFTTGLGLTGAGNPPASFDNGNSYYFVTPIIGAPATSDLASAHPGKNFYTYGNTGTGPNSKKIFSTATDGTSWSVIGTAGVGGFGAANAVRAVSHGIGVSPVDLNHIAAAGLSGVVLITTDGGTTWTERNIASLGVPAWPLSNANLAWADNSKLYLCSEATTAGVSRVAKSLNGGASWTSAASGLPDVPVAKLAVDPGDATGDTVYAATWLGLYRTTNGGTSWAPYGTGQPQGFVSDIYVAPDSSFMRIAFYGRGVYEMVGSAALGIGITSPASTVTLAKGGTQSYTATLTNFSNANVNWTVGAGGGTFSPTSTASGSPTVFTAGSTASTYSITATAAQDGITNATQSVTVVDPTSVTVSVAPSAPTVVSGAAQAFTATVTAITDTAVTWGISPAVGSINASTGLYTAPATPPASPQSVTVTATSTGAPTRTGTATVTVPVLTISVSPTPVSVQTGNQQQFTATVAGSTNTAVTWSIFSGIGSVNGSGLYTAPGSTGAAVVRATSVADTGKFADAAVTVIPHPITVTVTPNPTSVVTSATKQFSAAVANAADTTVAWSVQEGASGGTISGTGLYTAPATTGTFHIVATSNQDHSTTGTAAVTVQNPVTISITPTVAYVQPGGSATFTGVPSTGGTNYTVVGGAANGSITSGGVYTAPATLGDYTVVATATSDNTKTASATVHVQNIAVVVSPNPATLQTSTDQQFTATVTANFPQGVNWSVVEGAPGGSITGTGLYTAPGSAGTYHVRATSVADGSKSDTATVTVQSAAVLTVAVSPSAVAVPFLGNQTFTATVTNGPAGVTWTVEEAGGGNVSAGGVYTAPATLGIYHVRATSTSDTSKLGRATVTVISPITSFTISPTLATILTGGTVVLNGTVNTGTIDWITSGGSLNAASGASVTFTAPATTGAFIITASASADTSQTRIVTINVKTRDQDANGTVDVLDLAFLARYFGTSNFAADLDGLNGVDDADITIFLNGF